MIATPNALRPTGVYLLLTCGVIPRLLDLGFEKKIREIVAKLDGSKAPGVDRCTVLLSATLHAKLPALAALLLKDPMPVGFR